MKQLLLIGTLIALPLIGQTPEAAGSNSRGGGASSVSGSGGVTCTPTTGAVVCSLDTTVADTRTNAQANQDNVIADVTGSDTYACTVAASGLAIPTLGAGTIGSLWQLYPSTGNTGAATCQGLSIVRSDGSALVTGDIVVSKANFLYQYDATTLRRVQTVVTTSTIIDQVWKDFASNDSVNGPNGLANTSTTTGVGPAAITTGDATEGLGLNTGGVRSVVAILHNRAAITTAALTFVSTLQINNTGTGTYVIAGKAKCIPLGSVVTSGSYGATVTATVSVTSGAYPASQPSVVLTPGGTCSANSVLVAMLFRDQPTYGTDTAIDSVVMQGTWIITQ